MNRHAPMKKINKCKQKIMTKPWISDQLLKKIKHRNKLFAKKKNNPDDTYTKSVYYIYIHTYIRMDMFILKVTECDIRKSEKNRFFCAEVSKNIRFLENNLHG